MGRGGVKLTAGRVFLADLCQIRAVLSVAGMFRKGTCH
jgi:hypothetical protein